MHFKYLANSLALVYNFCSPVYNFRELAEDYDWKIVMCFPSLNLFCVCMHLCLLADKQKFKCGGVM